jgi:amino acid transporter
MERVSTVEEQPLMPKVAEKTHLRRAMGLGDLVLFFIMTGFSIRWIATAASAGPSSLVVWIIALLTFYIPLVFSVLELSSRYPEEGGLYIWSKRAWGEFAGFMTGWTYWSSNLVYFPAILYFAAGNALFMAGNRWQHLSGNQSYFIVFSLLGLSVATVLNIVGLDVGKWLHNVGAVCLWVPAMALIVLGMIAWMQYGPATEITWDALLPRVNLKDVAFWSTIAFALAGIESASVMGEEIKDARRNIPRALVIAGTIITSTYILATLCVLLALPRNEVSGLQGIMQAIAKAADRIGIAGFAPIAAALITVSGLGTVGAWLAAVARLPFVAGIDHFLPAAFGRLHPKWRTPYIALLVQAVLTAICIFLGQAGTSVKGAYDALVSMGVITYFLPFLPLFAAMIKLQREPAAPDVIRVPGGKPVAIVLASIGVATTAISILFAIIPAEDELSKTFAVTKVVGLTSLLVLVGVVIYAIGKRSLSKNSSLESESGKNLLSP